MRKGQIATSFALTFTAIVALLLSLQVFVRMSLEGIIRKAVDELTSQTKQYEPYYSISEVKTLKRPKRKERTFFEGAKRRQEREFALQHGLWFYLNEGGR